MKKVVLLLTGLLITSSLFAQSISGMVTDSDGNPLAGANVEVVDTGQGSSSDASGSYMITGVAPGVQDVKASYIGHRTQTKSVEVSAGGANLNFALAVSAVSGEGVFVTGTRAAGRTAMKSPTPIDGFDNITLRRQGNGDITETLKNQVPSFNATPLTGDGSAFVRSTSMRGLPSDNVLVLTNSKRRHRSALIAHFGATMNVGAQGSDIAMIPSIAVKRLEVLRDGASAQYGSDAIAGVMNFILKDNNEGIEFELTQGQWMTAENGRGGERDIAAAVNIGMPLSEDGFLNVSAEYAVRPELSRGYQHASAQDGYKGWVKADDESNEEGKYVGTQNVDDWQTAMNWGRPENNGFRSVWNAGMAISDNVEAYSFGNYADTYGEYSFFLRAYDRKDVLGTIPLDPQDPSKGDFSWSETYPLGFTPRLEGHGNDFSSVFGVKGENLGGYGVNYDFSTSYGSHYIHYYLRNTLNLSWGPNSPHNFEIGDLQQEETNWNADFTYPMGDINVAFGAEWREEKYTMYEGQKEAWMAGPWGSVHTLAYDSAGTGTLVNYGYSAPGLSANGMQGTSPYEAGVFKRDNTGFYADVEYDMDALLVQAAARFEDFSDFGSTSNFKVSGRYAVENLVTLRGGYSTGFHAPTPGQSNYSGVTTSFDGATGLQVLEGTLKPTDPLSVAAGGKALEPETSTNLSAGFTTTIISGLNLSVDYYDIEIDNKILKSRALPLPAGYSNEFEELAFYTNALDTKTSGIDVVAIYNMGKTNVALALNTNETKLVAQRQVNGLDPLGQGNIDNLLLNLPKMKMTTTVTHQINDALSAMVRINYYGESWDERGTYGEDKDKIDATMFIDAEISYKVSDNLIVVFGANNALNQFPNQIATRMGQGMPYPRRSPLGYHGGIFFTRLAYNF